MRRSMSFIALVACAAAGSADSPTIADDGWY